MLKVCLIIEGAYPHIAGGVSSWAQSLIKSLPDIRFGVVSICYDEIKHKKNYVFPDNVIEYYELDISKEISRKDMTRRFLPPLNILRLPFDSLRSLRVVHDDTFSGNATERLIRHYKEMLAGNAENFPSFLNAVDETDISSAINSDRLIDFFKDYHLERYKGDNFLNNYLMWKFYFYTLIKLLKAKLPRYDIYHSLSTGFAGILGAALKIRYSNGKASSKFLLTEHGLYTVERMRLYKGQFGMMDNISDFFEALGKVAYHYADKITTVCGVNRNFQISEGAIPKKIEVVNNGIDVGRFSGIERRAKDDKVSMSCPNALIGHPATRLHGFPIRDFGNDRRVYKIALVGRIVPIKDIFTFIRACKIINEKIEEGAFSLVSLRGSGSDRSNLRKEIASPSVRNDTLCVKFYLIGPTDETKDYYKECQWLVKTLGLKDKVIFTGAVDVKEYYANMDIMVLSSISEAQPIVLIEAMAAGIPIVATDVGGVRELIEGIGIIVPPSSPESIAEAVIGILEGKKDKEVNTDKGKEKALRDHRVEDMVRNYRRVYEELSGRECGESTKNSDPYYLSLRLCHNVILSVSEESCFFCYRRDSSVASLLQNDKMSVFRHYDTVSMRGVPSLRDDEAISATLDCRAPFGRSQ